MLNIIISFGLTLLFYSCTTNNADAPSSVKNNEYNVLVKKTDTVQDTKQKVLQDSLSEMILNKIAQIPEVKDKKEYIENFTKHKSGISMIIRKSPTRDEPYYWIQVGYDNAIRFESYFNFYVYESGFEVKYLDTESDNVWSLEEWRKKKK